MPPASIATKRWEAQVFLWIAIAAGALMIVAAVFGFGSRETAPAAIGRIAFALLLIVTVASIALYAR